jgi:hypothetical protein
MNVSIQHMLAAVMRTLEGDVLPHLDPQSTPAGNLRACLMLLTHIEARVTHESRQLFEDNLELRSLLATVASSPVIDETLRASLRTALQESPPQDTWFDVEKAAHDNRRYQELLTQVIERLPGPRTGNELANELHTYLQRLRQRDLQLVEKALSRTPV